MAARAGHDGKETLFVHARKDGPPGSRRRAGFQLEQLFQLKHVGAGILGPAYIRDLLQQPLHEQERTGLPSKQVGQEGQIGRGGGNRRVVEIDCLQARIEQRQHCTDAGCAAGLGMTG